MLYYDTILLGYFAIILSILKISSSIQFFHKALAGFLTSDGLILSRINNF